eukprot:6482910-Prymnesium_polylepis.1
MPCRELVHKAVNGNAVSAAVPRFGFAFPAEPTTSSHFKFNRHQSRTVRTLRSVQPLRFVSRYSDTTLHVQWSAPERISTATRISSGGVG